MTTSRAIPPTRRGNTYRSFLVVAGLVAVVGIADAGRALFWLLLNDGARGDWTDYLGVVLRLIAWGILAVVAYTGWRKHLLPPAWALVALPLLTWALLLS